jgi:hypothetical protein
MNDKKTSKTHQRQKRDKREILYSILGALVLLGGFVFKEVLLDPLKEGLADARSLIAQYELTSDITQIGGLSDFSPPEVPDDQSGVILDRILDEDERQQAAYKISKHLEEELPKDIVDSKLLKQLSEASDKVAKSVGFEKGRSMYLMLSMAADLKDERIARKRQEATADELSEVRKQVVMIDESVKGQKWKVNLYTYCTWILFGVGLTLAVIGRIFHIPGLESAGGTG